MQGFPICQLGHSAVTHLRNLGLRVCEHVCVCSLDVWRFLGQCFFLGFISSRLLHWGSPDSHDLSALCHPLGVSSHMSFQRGLYFPNQWWKVLPVTIIPHCSFSILQLSSLFVNSIFISFFLQCVIHRKRALAYSAEFLFLCALHRAWHVVCVCVLNHFSHFWLFATLWTVACQALLSLGFSRQEYSSGLPSSPGDLPNPGIEPRSPAFQADALPSEPPGKPCFLCLLYWQVGSLPLVSPGKPWHMVGI